MFHRARFPLTFMRFEIEFPSLPLLPGKYFIRMRPRSRGGAHVRHAGEAVGGHGCGARAGTDTHRTPLAGCGRGANCKTAQTARMAHTASGPCPALKGRVVNQTAVALLDVADHCRGRRRGSARRRALFARPSATRSRSRHFVALQRMDGGALCVACLHSLHRMGLRSVVVRRSVHRSSAYSRAEPADAAGWKRCGGIGGSSCATRSASYRPHRVWLLRRRAPVAARSHRIRPCRAAASSGDLECSLVSA